MQYQLLTLLAFVAQAASVAVMPVPLASRQEPSLNLNSALYDGKCFYPTADPNFPDDLSEYLGRWYQVAGTVELFTLGCSCVFAEYSLNANGTVAVYNSCQLGALPNNINGTATPVDTVYGAKGVFQVSFPSVPGGGVLCPGPNYIVQSKLVSTSYAPALRRLTGP
jgi:apolipoprotein D and lipocalin family protein